MAERGQAQVGRPIVPDHRNAGAAGRRSGGAGKWVGVIVGIVIVAALVAWMVGWFGGEEEALVPTEQPEALEGEEAVVAPELEAEEVITGEEDLEEALEPDVIDDAELGEPAGDLDEGLAPAEDEGLLEEGGLDDDAPIFEGETATGEEGALEGEVGLGLADDPAVEEDAAPLEGQIGEDEPEIGAEQDAPPAAGEDDAEVILVPLEEPAAQ
jgi:hypothetical protein